MSTINTKRVLTATQAKAAEISHTNFMGGTSYDIKSPLLKLICMSSSSFFGEPMYYKDQFPSGHKVKHSGSWGCGGRLSSSKIGYIRKTLNAIDDYEWRNLSPASSIEKAIDEALIFNPEATLKWATILRREENIRVTPQVILVRAANNPKLKGTGLVRKYAPGIIGRTDEPATQMAYQLSAFGKPIPNSLRRSWADNLSKANEYSLAKYKMESRGVKTVDVANMAFGKGFYGYQTPIGKLMRGELVLGGDSKTWESIRSGGGSWEEAVEVMGHMALLRNIRNLVEAKTPPKLWVPKLVETAKGGKQLPFRYLSAYNMNKAAPGYVLDAIEQCLSISLDALPKLPGRSLILSDNSGSTRSTPISELSTMNIAQIGNLMGVLTGMISEEGILGVFGDQIDYLNIRKSASIMDQTNKATSMGGKVGQGTENGVWLALDKAIKNKEHFDNIFVYSDQQAGHGGLYGINQRSYSNYVFPGSSRYIDVAKMISDYRNKVNRKVNVFMVQIAGYEDTLLPEFYERTYILGGWSGSILKFARRMIDVGDQYFK